MTQSRVVALEQAVDCSRTIKGSSRSNSANFYCKGRDRRQEFSLRAVVPDGPYSDGQSDGCVQMLMNDYFAAGYAAAPADRLDLQHQVVKPDGVIPVDRTVEAECR